MVLCTHKPVPVFEAQQINTQEDADSWVAALTDNELVSGNTSFTNVRIELVGNTMWLKFTVTTDAGTDHYAVDTDLGGYALASKDNTVIRLWVEGVENFNLRYQPYPPATE
jgi:hypothetical protein